MKSAIRLKHIPILLATLALFTPALGFANAKAMTPDPAHTRVRFRSGLHRAAVAIAQYASGNYAAKGAHPVDLMQHFPLALRPAALAAFALCTSPELFETWQPKFHSLSDPEAIAEAAQFFERNHHLRSETLERLRLADPGVKEEVGRTLTIIYGDRAGTASVP